MTIHINTITPSHIICVSDRLMATPSQYVELDTDRYKHLILITDNARVVISFAGFAGILGKDGKLNKTTIDWLTQNIEATSAQGKHLIEDHIKDIYNNIQSRIDSLKVSGIESKRKLTQ